MKDLFRVCILFLFVPFIIIGCRAVHNPEAKYTSLNRLTDNGKERLTDSLKLIASYYPGEIGISVIFNDKDTICVNNAAKYPMMSVYKLHQGMATVDYLLREGISPDSIATIPRVALNPATWSPMMIDIKSDTISLPLRTLLAYAIEQSDNNASNYLFESVINPRQVDTFISTLIPRNSFQIKYSEAEMAIDHKLAYSNYTSPLGAAVLINRLYSDSLLKNLQLVRDCLDNCRTGKDRIPAPLLSLEGVKIGHKTGSGFRDGGILAAHNDVAFIRLPDGRHYSLAVFVKDTSMDEETASEAIARISTTVYSALR